MAVGALASIPSQPESASNLSLVTVKEGGKVLLHVVRNAAVTSACAMQQADLCALLFGGLLLPGCAVRPCQDSSRVECHPSGQ